MSPPGLLTVWDASFVSRRIDKRISLMFTVMTPITPLVGAGVVVAQFIG